MALSTTEVTLIISDWTEISDGSSQVLIQPRSQGQIAIYGGTSAPSAGTSVGITLEAPETFNGTGTTTGDKLYGKSMSGESEIVTVMKL